LAPPLGAPGATLKKIVTTASTYQRSLVRPARREKLSVAAAVSSRSWTSVKHVPI